MMTMIASGHKQIRLYISHGGLFGTFESIYHAVPVLGVPQYFDQYANVAAAVRRGYALQVDLDTVDEHVLEEKIRILIADQRLEHKFNTRIWNTCASNAIPILLAFIF